MAYKFNPFSGTLDDVGSSSSGGTSPLTTKGDIWGFSSADARIPVGADGTVLTADATQPLGVKWAASGGTGTVTSVASGTGLSGGPITTTGTLTANLSTGVSGGQTAIGGTGASDNLTLSSTSNGTKGKILFGTSAYDEVNNRLGIGTTSPAQMLDISSTAPSFQMTDTTASAKSLRVVTDANKTSFYEAAGAAGDILTFDLANKRIGIGTASPAVTFDMTGGIARVSRNAIATTSTVGVLINNSTLATNAVQSQWSPSLLFQGSAWDTGTQSFFLNWKVEIQSVVSGGLANGKLAFSYGAGTGVSSTTNFLVLDGFNSRMGINTSSPSKTLDVNGEANITGELAFTYNAGSAFIAIGIKNNGSSQLQLNSGTGGILFRNSADSADIFLVNNGGGATVTSYMDFLSTPALAPDSSISNYGGFLKFNPSASGFVFKGGSGLFAPDWLTLSDNGTGTGGLLVIGGSTSYPTTPRSLQIPINHWIIDGSANERILFEFQNEGETRIKGGETYGIWGDKPNVRFFDQGNVLLHDFRNTGDVKFYEGTSGSNNNFFNVLYSSSQTKIQTFNMPTSDPFDGTGTLYCPAGPGTPVFLGT